MLYYVLMLVNIMPVVAVSLLITKSSSLQCDVKGLNGLPMSIFEESLRKAKSELLQ